MTGTERKVFQKYYPPDYDPSKLRKEKSKLPGGRRNRQFVQRVMTPFNMQCNTCHEYIYKGKKFNMKRETVEGEQYLGLNLFRFYFRCPNCLAEITFKTDLENCDYKNEFGATRLFEAFKLHKEAERAKEAQEEKDAADPMKMLEKRTMMSRAEMEAMGDIQELQESSRHKEGVDVDRFLTNSDPGLSVVQRQKILEEEDEAYIRELYGKQLLPDGKVIKRLADEDEEVDEKPVLNDGEVEGADVRKPMDWKPVFSKDAPIKRGSDQKSMLSKFVVIKKKKPEASEPAVKEELCDAPGCSSASTSSTPKAGGLVGLADYGSSSDDE